MEKVNVTETVESQNGASSSSAYTMQVVSGPESEDVLVEIELLSAKAVEVQPAPGEHVPEETDEPEVENSKPIFVSEALEKNNRLWKKVRTHVGAGRSVNGWVTPLDSPLAALNNEIEILRLLDADLLEKNEMSRDQVECEIQQLKSVCEAGLANLLAEQKKVKETISLLPKKLERNPDPKQNADILKITKSLSELEKTIAKFSIEIITRQDGIESKINATNLGQIQGNLDIIYRGVKKSIESTQSKNEELVRQFSEIKSVSTISETAITRLETILTDYLQEVTLNQEIFLRLEDNFDNIKKKLPLILGGILVSVLVIGFRVFGVF